MKLNTGTTSLGILCCTLICILVIRAITLSKRIPKGLRLPPGPPGKPIVGNIPDVSENPVWEAADRFAKEHGGLVHLNLLGQSVILVNSPTIAQDLFEKRSSIYSDRVPMPMLVDLMGWNWNIAMMEYGSWWRRHRRISHQYFRPDAVVNYQDIQIRITRRFLQKLYESPGEFISHIRHLAGAVIMEVVYGIKILPKGDPYVELAEEGVSISAEAALPGKYLVNLLPSREFVPKEWMPGAGFHQEARRMRPIYDKMAEMPFKVVKDALEKGTAQPSMLASMLEDLSHRPDAPTDEAMVIRNVAGMSYAAGADTTVSAITTFMLAMLLYPEVQRKAQAELDSVVENRLPIFEDRSSLPYVTAVCKEVHRWHPTFPLGVAHRAIVDDVYGEYFIPAGSMVVGNAWSILHDEKIYGPNPGTFDPERFFRPGAIDPIGHFGFGRRICVGRYMAENSIFIAAASILKVFSILPAKDSNGHDIIPEGAYGKGLITHPEPFQCTIKPRSESALTLLSSAADD